MGDMPSSVEVASLGLAVEPAAAATGAEDPLVSAGVTSVAGSIANRKDVCSVLPSKAAKQRSLSAGFSLGHGFPLVPRTLFKRFKSGNMSACQNYYQTI